MDSYDTFRFVLHLLFILLIVLGSLLILLVIYVTKQYQSPSGLLIGNLALTDLLVGAFLLPFGIPAIYFDGWSSGRKLCVLNAFTNQVLSTVAILTLAAISLDRYVAIIHAIRYHQIMTLRRVGVIIVILWAFGVISGIFPLLGWGRYIYQHGTSLCVTDFKTDKSFTFCIFAVVFGIPLNVIFVIYFRIFMAVRKHVRAIRNNSIHPSNQSAVELANENGVQLTNQRADESANENTVHPTNQNTVQLTSANAVELTNQNAEQLGNDNAVQLTNQRADQLTNENAEQLTNQRADQLANGNAVQLTNQSTDQWANENTVHQTNHSTIQTANYKNDFRKNTNEMQLQGGHNYGINLVNENAAIEETIRSTNQNTVNTIHLVNENTVYVPTLDTPTNQQETSPANQQASDVSPTPSANQNHPLPLPTNQNKAKVNTANQNRGHKPTNTTLPRSKSFNKKLKKESKAALTMFAIIGVFVLSLTPFAVYNLYCLHTGESYEVADFITSKVAYSNAIFNPLVYGLMNKLFRKGFYQVFYMIFRCKKRPNDLERRFSAKSSFAK